MRYFLLFAFLCVTTIVSATNYYFSSASGDDSRTTLQAQSPLTPWRSIDKLNGINLTLKPGDSVFFKRGDVFSGTMNIRSSGQSGKVIYYGAYGVGSNPLFTGFTTLSGWTQHSGGIYYATLNAPASLNMVTINDVARGRGRWPNTGFLKYEGHVGNQSITDNELTSSPNWSGAEVVMRKYRFILDRHTITSHNGTTLNYSLSTTNGNNGAFVPVNGNGYFIQNHLNTLDQFGEWYYDFAAKRLYVFFGANAPSSYTVKASTREHNATVTSAHFLHFRDLSFEGGNVKGLSLSNSSNTLVEECHFYNQGASSFDALNVNWITVKGGSVNTSFSNGIFFEYNAQNCTVDGVSVYNTNMIPGAGRSGTGISVGITINGNGARIINNRVIGSGYNGISFLGDNILVERNLVDTYCTLKDDGGGIYTYIGGSNTTSYNRKIRNNIIVNAVGAYAGAETYWYEAFGKAAGIYLDEHVNNVEVTGNTVANGDWGGIFLHNAHHNVISNNIFYNFRYQVLISQYTAMTRSNTMTNNQYISKLPHQETLYYRTFVADNPSTMGTFSNNYYARPIDDNKVIHCDFYQSGGAGTQYYTLDQWKQYFGLDGGSQRSPVTYKTNINDSIRFEYNATDAPKVVPLDANYVDVTNKAYAGYVALQPFTGVVLLKTRTPAKTNQSITFPAIPNKSFGDAPFALNATASSGLDVSYRVVSGPAAVTGNVVTLTGAGTVVMEASQAGNATFNPAPPVTQSFTVGSTEKLSQTISFPAIADKVQGDPAFSLNASASSGLPVSFRVVSGPATISGNTVTLSGTGTVTIEALQAGNTNYNAANPVTQSFVVTPPASTTKQNQAITFPPIADKTFGDAPFALNATASSGLPVSYKVNAGPATVSGNTVTITGAGEVWIEASQAGNATFNAAPALSQRMAVQRANQTITFASIPNKVLGDAPFAVTATASSGLPVNYRVASGPATILNNVVTITGTGQVWIEASQSGNANFNWASSISQSFMVTAGTTRQNQAITFPPIDIKTFGDAPFALNAMASSGLNVSYRVVSGPATVAGNVVTLTGTGAVTIEATQAGNSIFNAAAPVSQSFSVVSSRVTKQEQSISFGTLAYKTYASPSFPLTATASSGLAVSYRVVSGPIRISGNAVTITGVGSVTIEAFQPGNTSFNAATPVQRSFTIGKAGQIITFATPPAKTFGDAPFALAATASSGLSVNFRVVSGPATITGNMVTLTGAGTVTVQASQPGNAFYSAAFALQRSFTVTQPALLTGTRQSAVETAIVDRPVTGEAEAIAVYPNPLRSQGTVRVQVSEAAAGYLAIYDNDGKLVKQLGFRRLEKGVPQLVAVDVKDLPKGTYYVRFAAGQKLLTRMIQVL